MPFKLFSSKPTTTSKVDDETSSTYSSWVDEKATVVATDYSTEASPSKSQQVAAAKEQLRKSVKTAQRNAVQIIG